MTVEVRVRLVDEPRVPRGDAQGGECGDDQPAATVFAQKGQDDKCQKGDCPHQGIRYARGKSVESGDIAEEGARQGGEGFQQTPAVAV